MPKWSSAFGNISAVVAVAVKVITEVPLSSPGDQQLRYQAKDFAVAVYDMIIIIELKLCDGINLRIKQV